MTDTFKSQRDEMHFSLWQGGKHTHTYILTGPFFDILMEKETLGFYATALVCGYDYILSRSSKTIIKLEADDEKC